MPNWTNNAHLDALIIGFKITNPTINYFLDSAGGAWTAIEAAAFEQATQTWENVANIQFNRVFDANSAQFIETKYTSSPGDLGSHQHWLGSTNNQVSNIFMSTGQQLTGRYNVDGFGWDENTVGGGLQQGGNGFATIVHELGHGLGLDHTHSDDMSDPHTFPGVTSSSSPGTNNLNDSLYSIMSYRDGPLIKPVQAGDGVNDHGVAGGPMAFDIAVIQFLYGANMSYKTGNDTYVLPENNGDGTFWTAIWDAGGTDTISYLGNKNAMIDLRAATLQNEAGGGGFVSQAGSVLGGFTIANGVVIEQASGGNGNDTIVGNDANNTIWGNAGVDSVGAGWGNDKVYGGAGDDWLYGHGGGDILDGGQNDDRIWGGSEADTIGGGDGNDWLFGEDGNDWIYGNAGNDNMNGDNGNDVLFGVDGLNSMGGGAGMDTIHSGYNHDWSWGGADADLFHFAGWSWHDFIMDFQDGVDKIDLAGEGWGYTSTSQFSIVNDANGDAFISLGFNTWISVIGVSSTQLTDADFMF